MAQFSLLCSCVDVSGKLVIPYGASAYPPVMGSWKTKIASEWLDCLHTCMMYLLYSSSDDKIAQVVGVLYQER